MTMTLEGLPGIGRARLEALEKAGIRTMRDLLMTLPSSYRDTTSALSPDRLEQGAEGCVEGKILRVGKPSFYKGRSTVKAVLDAGGVKMEAVFINQPWAATRFEAGENVAFYGRISRMKTGRWGMYCPAPVTERAILPEYRTLSSIPGKTLRKVILAALEHLDECCPETLPPGLRKRYCLCERNFALRQAHFPSDRQSLDIALRRMAFEEILLYQAAASMARGRRDRGVSIRVSPEEADRFFGAFPFPPTGAQKRVLEEIRQDLGSETAMGRLVQGDVGSGKTAVAFGAMYLSWKGGYASALMAPTEILARQHYEGALKILGGLGMRVALVTGSMKAGERKETADRIRAGEVDAVIGTHALLSGDILPANLGLAVTDEQHRFGVRQRKALSEKGENVNALVMSATPIPRTLSLILYGDLDISVIDEMPPGRIPVRTRVVPEEKREGLYGFIRDQAAAGRQCYIVCPLVEENEALDCRSAQEEYAYLSGGPLKELRLGVTWGGQKEEEKQRTLAAFAAGETDVLVSTTVIEVGVNVPNASVMVIENAERFGLSQLHQLRGRVGRGGGEAWCFLMAAPNPRLKALCESTDGFRIAEEDLKQRGPGDFLGTRQHGHALLPALALGGNSTLLSECAACVRELNTAPFREERDRVYAEAERVYGEKMKGIAMN